MNKPVNSLMADEHTGKHDKKDAVEQASLLNTLMNKLIADEHADDHADDHVDKHPSLLGLMNTPIIHRWSVFTGAFIGVSIGLLGMNTPMSTLTAHKHACRVHTRVHRRSECW